jgi:transposase, IS5 family
MRGQAGFFDVDERLKALSAKGDQLERLCAIVNFELIRPDLVRAVPRSDGAKGGRPNHRGFVAPAWRQAAARG